ncbi:MAG: carboxypeptidase regulatory-like domain-containing protein, partial [Kofleriaceae bacterium]
MAWTRRVWLGAVAALAIGLGLWTWRGDPPARSPTRERAGQPAAPTAARVRPDPSTLARGSLAGTIRDEAGEPLAGAQVCARGRSNQLDPELLRAPPCTTTDPRGRYRIVNLLPGVYVASAAAPSYRPARHRDELALAVDQHRTGIDIALRRGGVEITGVVSDATGGPAGRARIAASLGGWRGEIGAVYGEADDQGRFALWVAPGPIELTATLDGYSDAIARGAAPGTFELRMLPASSLSGVVRDAATGQPVPDARVVIASADGPGDRLARTGADGAFRIARLEPGRFAIEARTDHGYGRSEGSIRVGLAEHVEGAVVTLFPAHRIEARLVSATTRQPCAERARAWLTDAAQGRSLALLAEPDGTLWADGVLPGTYHVVEVECAGHVSRAPYAPVVVADRDATGLVWEVDPGATIRGKVRTRTGAAVADADVWASSRGGAPRAVDTVRADRTRHDGSYELTGLRPGSHQVFAASSGGSGPPEGAAVEVPAGGAVIRDLVLDDE